MRTLLLCLLLAMPIMAGEPPDTSLLYIQRIDTTKIETDTVWAEKIVVRLTPEELKTLMELLHPQELFNDTIGNYSTWIIEATDSLIPISPYQIDTIELDTSIYNGVLW